MSDVVYLCDRKACASCAPDVCDHTTDISHARNFVKYSRNHRGEEFYREEPPGYAEDEGRLEVTKGYQPRELSIILDFLEHGMLYDRNGQLYTRRYLTERANNKF